MLYCQRETNAGAGDMAMCHGAGCMPPTQARLLCRQRDALISISRSHMHQRQGLHKTVCLQGEPVPFAQTPKLSNSRSLEAAVDAVADMLNSAVRPVLLAGNKARPCCHAVILLCLTLWSWRHMLAAAHRTSWLAAPCLCQLYA